MITVRLQGGLGNQLFQYAAGRALADRLGRGLGLDLRDFSAYARRRSLSRLPWVGARLGAGDTPRPYLLDRFPIRAVPTGGLGLLAGGFPRSRPWRRRLRRFGLGWGVLVEEAGGASMEGLAKAVGAGGHAYLDGYWQSWRYPAAARPALLRDLALLRGPQGRNAELLGRLGREKSVCVHVRRGDYVSLPAAAAFHGLMGPDYYRAAVKRLGAAAKGAVFYVFSDDPDWARRHLRLPGRKVVVDHNGVDEPQEDLRLMAACRHFITANSSFSWWGAWLGGAASKRVVAPRRWFKSGESPADLCPPEWMRL